jgi:inosine-uridine nucleoside N-ribohydrolase
MRVLFDTDANNELDDQHALAYLLFNSGVFRVEGVTVNATRSGGNIDMQAKEAERVLRLCKSFGKIPLLMGANGSFLQIKDSVSRPAFDGHEAVNFILEASAKPGAEKLILIAVGKLTNVALALTKDPSLADRVRVVWLGSNYPDPGEYNLENDTASLNYVLNSGVPFEMVTVRYGKPTGTAAVSVTKSEIASRMPGKGPRIGEPVEGRHGGMFSTFGDYSVSLFEHIDYHGDPPARALFDMAAVAIVKDPQWAQSASIPAPVLLNGQWKERPENARTILVWENFDKESILTDFYHSMDHYRLPDLP